MEWRGAGEQLQPTIFGDHDGPPWSEDEDLQSPVVTSARHRKNKSNMVAFDQTRGRSRERDEPRRGSFQGTNGDGSETYYVSDLNEANGPGGEYITYPASTSASLDVPQSLDDTRRDSHFAASLPNRSHHYDHDEEMSSSPLSPEDDDDEFEEQDDSRYSRDYQFTIASPDEEMHGRAVALFDFARENENELPLVEGQVILVSYRHGQGWLVAQDPKTGESGLVPEEYVRLLKDIEGGWNGLMNGGIESSSPADGPPSEVPEVKTPTQQEHAAQPGQNHQRVVSGQLQQPQGSDYYPPVLSTFSTTREDLEPWPHREHLLNSQAPTPTTTGGFLRRPSQDHNAKQDEDGDEEMVDTREANPDEDLGSPHVEGGKDMTSDQAEPNKVAPRDSDAQAKEKEENEEM